MAADAPRRPSLAPRNWPGWLMVAFMWGLGWLPRPVGRALVPPLGLLLRVTLTARRRIAERNLDACFPERSGAERRAILKQGFASLARMLVETAWCWARPAERLMDMIEMKGHEHLKSAMASGRGVLIVTAHFTCLEIGAMAWAHQARTGRGVYRPLRNEVLEWYQNRGRTKYPAGMISKRDMRGMVRFLRGGGLLWYAPDQDFGPRNSVFVPFFGIPAATLLATHRLPRMTGCLVLTLFPYYDRKRRRYVVELSKHVEDYPSADPKADLARINAILEAQVRRVPEQYWWIHRRFKTRPPGEPPFYGAG